MSKFKWWITNIQRNNLDKSRHINSLKAIYINKRMIHYNQILNQQHIINLYRIYNKEIKHPKY